MRDYAVVDLLLLEVACPSLAAASFSALAALALASAALRRSRCTGSVIGLRCRFALGSASMRGAAAPRARRRGPPVRRPSAEPISSNSLRSRWFSAVSSVFSPFKVALAATSCVTWPTTAPASEQPRMVRRRVRVDELVTDVPRGIWYLRC